jgi:hypothetical protein
MILPSQNPSVVSSPTPLLTRVPWMIFLKAMHLTIFL